MMFQRYRLPSRHEVTAKTLIGSLRRLEYVLRSLTYNINACDTDYLVDTILNPVLFPLDHLTASLGPFLVAMVVLLLGSVIVVCYVLGIEWYLRHELHFILSFAFVLGHFLQMSAWWHFYKVCRHSTCHIHK